MARGSIAKVEVIKKIQEVFGEDFIGEYDKKIYVQALESGEMVQIAIALTCPKTPVAVSSAPAVTGGRMDFESDAVVMPTSNAPAQITDEERQTVADLMAKLGL